MTQPDFELLADYVGGALDGTPEAEVVRRKIRDDVAWATAYADLTAAFAEVGTQLASMASYREPMPDDVWQRLSTALSAEPAGSVTLDAAAERPSAAGAGADQGVWVPPVGVPAGQAAPGPRKRPRWVRWLAPVTVAAAVLGVVGVGASLLRPGGGVPSSTTAGQDQSAPEMLMERFARLSTGRDYTPQTLALLTDDTEVSALKSAAQTTTGVEELAPFADPVRLDACLAEIGKVAPGTVAVVDLAKFQGSPAVVVVKKVADGSTWVGAAGPGCGLTGADLLEQRTFG